jgi:hypothetical protein
LRNVGEHVKAKIVAAHISLAALFASGIGFANGFDDDYAQWDIEQAKRAEAVTFPLDEAYLQWETRQSGLADIDLQRRLAKDAKVKQQLALNSEYARWEALKSAQAFEELDRKAEILTQAKQEVEQAQDSVAKAQAALEGATEANRAQLQRALSLASEFLAQKQGVVAVTEADREQARELALNEAKARHQANQQAIIDRYEAHQAVMERAQNITPLEPKLVYATVEVSLRSGPAPSYEVVEIVKAGTPIEVNGSSDQFWRTISGSFVSQRYTQDQPLVDRDLVDTDGQRGPTSPPSTTTPHVRNSQSAPESQRFKWTTYVANSNGQGAVDQCTGGLTKSSAHSKVMGRSFYAIHNACNGKGLLELELGDKVLIQNVGVFKVVESRDVDMSDTTAVIRGIDGEILMQTCHDTGTGMRVLGLDSI